MENSVHQTRVDHLKNFKKVESVWTVPTSLDLRTKVSFANQTNATWGKNWKKMDHAPTVLNSRGPKKMGKDVEPTSVT